MLHPVAQHVKREGLSILAACLLRHLTRYPLDHQVPLCQRQNLELTVEVPESV